jgi:hypothetical protein
MAIRAAKQFDKTLGKLFADRTHWLRAQVRKPGLGKPPAFNKKKVEKYIQRFRALATECLIQPHAIDGLGQLYDLKKQWRVKGRGIVQKRKALAVWFEQTIPFKNFVYVL